MLHEITYFHIKAFWTYLPLAGLQSNFPHYLLSLGHVILLYNFIFYVEKYHINKFFGSTNEGKHETFFSWRLTYCIEHDNNFYVCSFLIKRHVSFFMAKEYIYSLYILYMQYLYISVDEHRI